MYRYKNSILKRKKGITLIALVITIIVLLILSGISVSMLYGNNGILGKTTEAKFKSKISEYNEELELYISNKKIEYISERESYDETLLEANNQEVTYNGNKVESETIENVLTTIDNKYKEKIRISSGKLKYKGNDNQEEIWLANIVEGINQNVEISKVETTEEKQNSIILDNSTEHEVSNLKIYGESEQNGIPTPDSPVEVVSLGENSKNLFNPKNIDYRLFRGRLSETLGYVTSDYIDLKNYSYIALNQAGSFGWYSSKSEDSIINWDNKSVFNMFRCYQKPEGARYVRITALKDINIIAQGFNNEVVETDLSEYKPYRYIDVVNTEKNMFDINSISTTTPNFLGENIVNNGDGTLTLNSKYGQSTKKTLSEIAPNLEIGKTYTYHFDITSPGYNMMYINGVSWVNHTFVLTETMYNGTVSFYNLNTDGVVMSSIISNFQLEEGSKETQYEPYHKIITTIDLTGHEPLRKVGDISDYIDYKNKKIVRNIGYYAFKGTENITESGSITGTDGYSVFVMIFDNTIRKTMMYCNMLPVDIYLSESYLNREVVANTTAAWNIRIAVLSSRVAKNDYVGFKKYLKDLYDNGTPLEILYKLSTPIEEDINLPEIKTFNGTTNISINSNIVPSKIECDYYKSK